jgi:hypothetical protein
MMQASLEPTGRPDIPITRKTHELPQTTAPNIPPERRKDVLRVDRVNHPKRAFLRHRLNVGCPNQPTIGKSSIRPWANVTEYNANANANGTACMNMDIPQVGRDQPVVVLTHCFGDAKEIEVLVALFV